MPAAIDHSIKAKDEQIKQLVEVLKSIKKEGILKNIIKFLEEFNKKNNWKLDEGWIWETLSECGEEVYSRDIGTKRWWKNVFVVKEIDGALIGFNSAEATGDNSPEDLGWEFDEESICNVIKKEETKVVVTYERSN